MCHFGCCLSGDTTIQTVNGLKPLSSLKNGDMILTLGKRNLSPKFSPFHTFLHRETRTDEQEFVVLQTSNGKNLTLSPDHVVFAIQNGNRLVPKMTKNLSLGDHLVSYDQEGFVSTEITGFGKKLVTEFYAPLTKSGTFLANGILVTSFAGIENFKLAKAVTTPVRYGLFKTGKETNGIHKYARFLMKIRDASNLLSSQNSAKST